MEGFTYTNIFETKGIEYLVIITFFLVLVPFWLLLNRKRKASEKAEEHLLLTAGSFVVPKGIFFSKFHSWAHLQTDGLAKVGIDEFLLRITGSVNYLLLKEPGEWVRKGEVLIMVEHEGKKLEVLSPLTGRIEKANSTGFADSHDTTDPAFYKNGWICQIQPSSWKTETVSCYLADEALQWFNQELKRVKDFIAESVKFISPDSVQVVMQDGGELYDQPLTEFPRDVWNNFQEQFLS
jgi:glycine cleavage system H protein